LRLLALLGEAGFGGRELLGPRGQALARGFGLVDVRARPGVRARRPAGSPRSVATRVRLQVGQLVLRGAMRGFGARRRLAARGQRGVELGEAILGFEPRRFGGAFAAGDEARPHRRKRPSRVTSIRPGPSARASSRSATWTSASRAASCGGQARTCGARLSATGGGPPAPVQNRPSASAGAAPSGALASRPSTAASARS
jgi:hypothetical protein